MAHLSHTIGALTLPPTVRSTELPASQFVALKVHDARVCDVDTRRTCNSGTDAYLSCAGERRAATADGLESAWMRIPNSLHAWAQKKARKHESVVVNCVTDKRGHDKASHWQW